MPYAEAAELAYRSAKSDSENFRRRLQFRPKGTSIEAAENTAALHGHGRGQPIHLALARRPCRRAPSGGPPARSSAHALGFGTAREYPFVPAAVRGAASQVLQGRGRPVAAGIASAHFFFAAAGLGAGSTDSASASV